MGEDKFKKKQEKLKYKIAKKQLKAKKKLEKYKTEEPLNKSLWKGIFTKGIFEIIVKVIAAIIATYFLWKLGMK